MLCTVQIQAPSGLAALGLSSPGERGLVGHLAGPARHAQVGGDAVGILGVLARDHEACALRDEGHGNGPAEPTPETAA